MKKLLIICLTCLLGLSGCSSTSQTNTEPVSEPIHLSIWHYYGGVANQTFSYLVQKFNQTVGAENNITVEAFSYDGVGALSSAITTAASGNAGVSPLPSIFASYSDSVVPLAQEGLVADLADYLSAEDLASYYAPFIEEGRMGNEDQLLILPIAKSTEVLHINQAVFDEFAAETGCTYDMLKTWEGIAEVAEIYYNWTDAKTDYSNDGSAFFGTDGMANFMIIGTKQLGNDILMEENGVVSHQFTEEIAQNFWDVFYIPFMQGYFAADAYYRSDDLTSGAIVAYVGSTASSYYFPAQSQNLDGEYVDTICKTMSYPVFADGDDVAVQQGAGMVVSKSTPEEEAAAAFFLSWFTQEENNCGFAVSTGYMPVKNDVLDIDIILEEMARDGSVDEDLPIVQATYSTYEQLDTYDFYTSLPCVGSADARTILEYSLTNKISADQENFTKRLSSGETYSDILDDFMSDDNFQAWYADISSQLDAALQP